MARPRGKRYVLRNPTLRGGYSYERATAKYRKLWKCLKWLKNVTGTKLPRVYRPLETLFMAYPPRMTKLKLLNFTVRILGISEV